MRKLLIFLIMIFLSKEAFAQIVCSSLTTGQSATDASSYATASITPTANSIVLLSVWSDISSGPPVQPTATGNSLTWTAINSDTNATDVNRRLTILRAMGSSPSTGAITIDFASETQRVIMWNVSQCSDVINNNDGGASVIIHSGLETSNAFGTSDTIVLPTFIRSGNVAFGAYVHGTNEATTPDTGFTELSDQNINDGGLISGMQVQYAIGRPTMSWSWATSSLKFGVATELNNNITTIRNSTLRNATIY